MRTLVLLFFVLPVPLRGHTAESSLMTMTEAVEYALIHNAEVQAERGRIAEAQADLIRARRIANPSVEFEYVTGKGAMSSTPPQPFVLGKLAHIPLAPGQVTRFTTLRLSKSLEIGFQRGIRKRIAETNLHRVKLDIGDIERRFTGEVKQAFFELLHRQREVALADTVLSVNEQLLSVAQSRFEAGETSVIDVKLASVEAMHARNRRAEAASQLTVARINLNRLLGRPAEEHLAAAEEPTPQWIPPDVLQLVTYALDHREDLRSLEYETVKANERLVLARRERIPDLMTSATYERLSGSNLFGGQINFQLPLFDRNQGEIAEWEATSKRLVLTMNGRRERVRKDVQAAYQRLSVAHERLNTFENGILDEAEKTLALVRMAYQIGEVGLIAVIRAQEQVFETRSHYLDTQNDIYTAAVELEMAISGHLSEIGGFPPEISTK